METLSDGRVILKDFEEGKKGQIWYQETSYAPNAKGYIILRDSYFKGSGILTPALIANGKPTNDLYLEGNISLSKIII